MLQILYLTGSPLQPAGELHLLSWCDTPPSHDLEQVDHSDQEVQPPARVSTFHTSGCNKYRFTESPFVIIESESFNLRALKHLKGRVARSVLFDREVYQFYVITTIAVLSLKRRVTGPL